MTYEEYNDAERENMLWLTTALVLLLRPYASFPLTDYQWLSLLDAVFPYVEYAFEVSARNARAFYDAERRRKLEDDVIDLDFFRRPVVDRHDFTLPEYDPSWFPEAMASVKDKFVRGTGPEPALSGAVAAAVKEAQSGGRRAIRRGTDSDPRAVGWARVEGGGESCGFCLMLISRGPVYKNANDAGLKAADNESALRIWRRYEKSGDDAELLSLMNRWHERCDCRVVPVFDRKSWPGRDQYVSALEMWNRVTRSFTGRDKLNAFRRALRDGYTADSPPLAA